jgi:predicted O-methyltransferase YrrM
MQLIGQKVQRAMALTKKRGAGWLIRSILAEVPLLPGLLIALARLASGSQLARCLASLSGVHTNQAWAERADKLKEITRSFVQSKPIDLLEIGTWFGEGSTAAFFEALPDGSNVVLVDPWKPYSTEADKCGAPSASAKKMDCVPHIAINSTLNRIYQLEKTRNITVTLVRSPSDDFLPLLKGRSFDVIYIDGSHYYDAVKRDIQHAKRLIRDDGLICGDDLDLPPTDDLLQRARQHLDQDLMLLEQGKAIHPGVLVAVAEEFERVNCHEGFWWIYVNGGKFLRSHPNSAPVDAAAPIRDSLPIPAPAGVAA